MKIKIRGKIWEYMEVPYLGKRNGGPHEDGDCDGPHIPNKKIRILKSLKGQRKLETQFHETQHAAQWDLDEEVVEEIGNDFGRIFYKRFGYREINPILKKIAKDYKIDEIELIKEYGN